MAYARTDQVVIEILGDDKFRVWNGVENDCGEHIDFDPVDVGEDGLANAVRLKSKASPELIKQWEEE